MFGYEFDAETGGLLLNDSTPNSSKEPRPVYATEMRMLHMDEWFAFEDQNDRPYLWAEAASYYYRGELIARTKGGSLCEAPVMDYLVASNESGEKVPAVPRGYELQPVDVDSMVAKNADMMAIIEQVTVKKIYDYWKRYQKRLDCFHVAFSGGKDSMVLLELVKKALPHNAFMVVFGDTKMEFPDTYKLVDIVEQQCKDEGIAFYRASSHLDPNDSWRLFGPPSRTLRWCCTVHKSTPQTLKIREILGKPDYVGADLVGVRAAESLRRSEYEAENYGTKQKGQYAFYPILDWTSSEVWMYLFSRGILINNAYKFGSTRVGCLFCPMGGDRCDYLRHQVYTEKIDELISAIRDTSTDSNVDSYIANGGWASRRSGRDIAGNIAKYSDEIVGDKLIIHVTNPSSDWREWIKTLGDINFPYSVQGSETDYYVYVPAAINATTESKFFKNVFHKAAYCIGCKVCQCNCPFSCISFENGLKITGCRHCRKCHEIDYGCLMYNTLRIPITGGNKKVSNICSFAGHAPKPEWIEEFFAKGNDFWSNNSLGPNQVKYFKVFLPDCGLVAKRTYHPTTIFDLVQQLGWNTSTAWGVLYTNLSYNNAQIRWYIDNMQIDSPIDRKTAMNLLENAGLSHSDAGFVVGAFKRLVETPLGEKLHFGTVNVKGATVQTLTRTKCTLQDDRVLLYALYRYAEACQDYYEFSLSRLMNTSIDSAGISPVKLFGFVEDEMITMLNGLSAKYPAFINVTFTHGLDKISLREDKTSDDVLKLFS